MGWWPESWRFGRTGPTATQASPALPPADPSGEAARGEATRGEVTGPVDPGWRALAPLQRSSHVIEPVAPLSRFTGDLRSHQDPRFVAPLSHLRSPSGPAGQVEGLIHAGRPLQRVETSELTVRADTATPQRPRATRTVQRFAGPWDASTAPAITSPADETAAHVEESAPLEPPAAEPPTVEPATAEAPALEAPSVEQPTQQPTGQPSASTVQRVAAPEPPPEPPPLVLRRLTTAPPEDTTPLRADLPEVEPFATPVITPTTSGPSHALTSQDATSQEVVSGSVPTPTDPVPPSSTEGPLLGEAATPGGPPPPIAVPSPSAGPSPEQGTGTPKHRMVVGPPLVQRAHTPDPGADAGGPSPSDQGPQFAWPPAAPAITSSSSASPDVTVSRETAPAEEAGSQAVESPPTTAPGEDVPPQHDAEPAPLTDAESAPLTGESESLTAPPSSTAESGGPGAPASRTDGPELTVSRIATPAPPDISPARDTPLPASPATPGTPPPSDPVPPPMGQRPTESEPRPGTGSVEPAPGDPPPASPTDAREAPLTGGADLLDRGSTSPETHATPAADTALPTPDTTTRGSGPDLVVSRQASPTAPSDQGSSVDDSAVGDRSPVPSEAPLTGGAAPLISPAPADRPAAGRSAAPAVPASTGSAATPRSGPDPIVSRQTTTPSAPTDNARPIDSPSVAPAPPPLTVARVPSAGGPAPDQPGPGTPQGEDAADSGSPTWSTPEEPEAPAVAVQSVSVDAPLTGESPLGHPAEQHHDGHPADSDHLADSDHAAGSDHSAGHGPGPDSAMPLHAMPLQRLPLAGHPVEAPLTGDAERLLRVQASVAGSGPTGTSTPHTTGGRPRAALRVGAPVPTWQPARPDAEHNDGSVTGAPGEGPGVGGAPDLPTPRTLVPLSRMFATTPEPPAVDGGAPASTSAGAGGGPRLGIGLPLPGSLPQASWSPGWAPGASGSAPDAPGRAPGTPGPAPDANRSAPLPLQRTAYGAGPEPRPGHDPAASGVRSPDHESGSSGFTEVLLQRAQNETAAADVGPSPDGAGPEATTTGPPAAADPGSALPSGRALDELVERIYEPLTARLKTELWLDRERSGLMVNLRR